MITEHPWTPDPPGRMWTTFGHGFDAKSVRNDALWAAKLPIRRANIALALAWRDAAVADGWSIEPTYPNHESVDRAWRLAREGFSVQGISRDEADDAKMMPTAGLHIWGPDGLAIQPPPVYWWAAIMVGSRTCSACGTEDTETHRVGFAGRVCATCLPEMRRRVETPGWCN